MLPRVVALHRPARRARRGRGTSGAALAHQGQGSSDVLVRPYRHGDELRRVHWRSTARHDELMVRLEERPWRAGTTVLLDRRDGAHRGRGADSSLEFAISMAASVCAHLSAAASPSTSSPKTARRCQRPPLDPMLDALAALRPSAREDLTGPDLRTGRDVVAVLGAVTASHREHLMARHPKGGYAVLLDTATWDPADGPPRQRGHGGERAAQRRLDRGRRRGGQHPRPGLGRAVSAAREAVAIGGRSGRRHVARERAPRRDHPGLDVARRRGARRGSSSWRSGWCCTASGPLAVVAGQCLGLLVLLAARFADTPLPGPAAFARFAALAAGAGTQIATGIAPVPRTPEILFLVTVAFGAVLVAVYGAAVLAGAPAAAGVPLLAVFAVPAALDDSLLPWQAVVFAAAGFGVLLVLRDGARSQRLGGVVLVAVAVVAALGVGAAGTFVGTAGRFAGAGAGGSGAIGLSPFTTLRGQLTQERPTELFEVRGLPQPAYLRALTLSTYVPDVGWQATRPGPGPNLPGTLGVVAGGAVQIATVDVRNVGFKDYWLPLYGQPISVAGLSGRWTYDERTGTAYTARPRAERRLAADGRLLRAHRGASSATRGAAPVPWRPTSTPRASTAG